MVSPSVHHNCFSFTFLHYKSRKCFFFPNGPHIFTGPFKTRDGPDIKLAGNPILVIAQLMNLIYCQIPYSWLTIRFDTEYLDKYPAICRISDKQFGQIPDTKLAGYPTLMLDQIMNLISGRIPDIWPRTGYLDKFPSGRIPISSPSPSLFKASNCGMKNLQKVDLFRSFDKVYLCRKLSQSMFNH